MDERLAGLHPRDNDVWRARLRTALAQLRDMLECRRIKPLLQTYLDGQIREEEAVRVSTHLDACRRCGLAAETYRQIKAGLSRLAEEPDPETMQRLERFVDHLGES
jgi:anti-sigma factor RsiW